MARPFAYIFGCLLAASVSVSAQVLPPEGQSRALREILESRDSFALNDLAETLIAKGSADAIPVLAWMLAHRPEAHAESLAAGLRRLTIASGVIPVEALARSLLDGNIEQRRAAAIVLSEAVRVARAPDREAVESALIAALDDPNIDVRGWAALGLRSLDSDKGRAALRASLARTDVTADYYFRATGERRPGQPLQPALDPTRSIAATAVKDVAALLGHPDPDRRAAAAQFFVALFSQRSPRLTPAQRTGSIEVLIRALGDSNHDVRRLAAEALGRAQTRDAVLPLADSLKGRDVSNRYLAAVFGALAAIGDPRALPALQEWIQRRGPFELRAHAARAAIAISRTADPAAMVRKLLWEQPDTSLERDVLSRGRAALPAVWTALAEGPPADRRAAMALLAWFRDVRSVRPLSEALGRDPGPLSTHQLLFAINAILLTEAPILPDAAEIDRLAAQHLTLVYEDLISRRTETSRSGPPCATEVVVYPYAISKDFRWRSGSIVAAVADSAAAFEAALSKKGTCGLAFHPVRSAEGVARVATTIFLSDQVLYHAWITLHRRIDDEWQSMPFQRHDRRTDSYNEPNLRPSIERNYGDRDPLKIVRLNLSMERIRVRYSLQDGLHSANATIPGEARELDRSYVPLLEPYRTSDSLNVRYAAEFAVARLTGTPDIHVMIEAIRTGREPEVRRSASALLSNFVRETIEKKGEDASAAERTELVAAARSPDLAGDPVAPRPLPAEQDIRQVRRWRTFASVVVAIGVGIDGGSGYSMLFERRDGRWVFRCVVANWIS